MSLALIVFKVSVCFQTGLGGGSLLSLSDAVSQAARTAGVKPITSAEQLQDDLETQELKEAYAEQVSQPSCTLEQTGFETKLNNKPVITSLPL